MHFYHYNLTLLNKEKGFEIVSNDRIGAGVGLLEVAQRASKTG